jgi:hypothetical protein
MHSLQLAPPPAVAAGDIAEDIDWTEDMPVPVKRRVAALREVQGDYDKLIKQFIRERAELQAKYEQQAGEACASSSASSSSSRSSSGLVVPASGSSSQVRLAPAAAAGG